jgi:hypothetical protein
MYYVKRRRNISIISSNFLISEHLNDNTTALHTLQRIFDKPYPKFHLNQIGVRQSKQRASFYLVRDRLNGEL